MQSVQIMRCTAKGRAQVRRTHGDRQRVWEWRERLGGGGWDLLAPTPARGREQALRAAVDHSNGERMN